MRSAHRSVNLPIPDSVGVMIQFLAAHQSIVDLGATVRVNKSGFSQGDLWLTVSNPVPGRYNLARSQYACELDLVSYGPTKEAAHGLLRTAIASSLDAWSFMTPDTVILRVDPHLGPSDQSDFVTDEARYVASIMVHVRPR